MNRLIIRSLPGGEELIDSVKTYQLAERADWLAYQSGRKDSTLVIRSLDGKTVYRCQAVSGFKFAAKSGSLYCVSKGDSLGTKPGIYLFDPNKGAPVLIKEGDGLFKQPAISEQGEALAFLYCAKKDSAKHVMELWLSENSAPARLAADRRNRAIPKGWVISEHGTLRFSEEADRLFWAHLPNPARKIPPNWPNTAPMYRGGVGTNRCNIPSRRLTAIKT